MKPIIRWLVSLAVVMTTMLSAQAAEASHFRYGNITWRLPDPVNAPYTVEITLTTGWRASTIGSTQLYFGDGASTSVPSSGTTVGTGVDAVGEAYAIQQATLTHTYPGPGQYTAYFDSNARISSLINASNAGFRVEAGIHLTSTGSNSSGPISGIPVIIQMEIGGKQVFELPVSDPDADPFTCRFSTQAESDIPSGNHPPTIPGGDTLHFISPGCSLEWDTTGANTGDKYAISVAVESNHQGTLSKTTIDYIIQLIPPGMKPTCVGAGNYVAPIGQLFNGSVGASDPNGDVLTMSVSGLPSGATTNPTSGSTSDASPFTATMSWTPTPADGGTTNVVQFLYTNSMSFSNFCTMIVEVPNCPGFGTACTGGTCGTAPGVVACQGSSPICVVDNDGDGVNECDGDCNDSQALAYPGNTELTCDGIDNDCDPSTADGPDGDGDGISQCGGDCDDTDATIYPGAPDYCDSIDNDCDGTPDNGDTDGDGLNDCDEINSHNTDPSDDDSDQDGLKDGAEVNIHGTDPNNPDSDGSGASDGQEVADGTNPNDPNDDIVPCPDADADGYADASCGGTDCDDTDADVHPAATEQFCDGIDNDCSAMTDDDPNSDGDPVSFCSGDCNDSDPTIYPGNSEVLCDGIDQACNGAYDDDVDFDGDGVSLCAGDCDDGDAARFPGNIEILCDSIDNDCSGMGNDDVDADGDTVSYCSGDCDDSNAARFPGNAEICDGQDNDCDGTVPLNELDYDADGVSECQGDCNNDSSKTYPGATEVCDGQDNDCDGIIPQNELDADGDGQATCKGDCDDADAARFVGNPEICDAVDNDCDGIVPATEIDDDADGFSECRGDCNDASASTYPGAVELCDAVDNDCDGTVPQNELDADGDGQASCSGDCDDDDATNFEGNAEICDGQDNDCSGASDEGFGLGDSCSVGQGACVATGVFICDASGGATCSATLQEATTEICGNDIDENCDGNIDNEDAVCEDSDNDGLIDAIEERIGSDPFDADSDDDGVLDGDEPKSEGTGWDEDSDGDGLINVLDVDSDDDGLLDGTELGTDCSHEDTKAAVCKADADEGETTTNPLDADTDGSGMSDGSEDHNLDGALDDGETDPLTAGDDEEVLDSDGDGLSDGLEAYLGTDPEDADSDDDGLLDADEPNPTADADLDGLMQLLDVDSDDDGLFDGTELGRDCNHADTAPGHCVADLDASTNTHPLLADTDGDGLRDGGEDHNLDGAIDEGELNPLVKNDDTEWLDSDDDGLSDGLELFLGSAIADADSDDDGVLDGDEHNPADFGDADWAINLLDADSDDDGLLDGTEAGQACDHEDTAPGQCVPDADLGATTTSAVARDSDHGGASDGSEDANLNGMVDDGEMSPVDASDDVLVTDTDGDGLSDALEATLLTAPTDADSDDDGVLDGLESNPSQDFDADGIVNAADADSDQDGLLDGTELGLLCEHADSSAELCVSDADPTTVTNPLDADTDDGGLADGTEDDDQDGAMEAGEQNPLDASDDGYACVTDVDCGGANSGTICLDDHTCGQGCRPDSDTAGCPRAATCEVDREGHGICVDDEEGYPIFPHLPESQERTPLPGNGVTGDEVMTSPTGGGCGCELVGTTRSHGDHAWWLAALTGVGLVLGRRRRSA